MTICSSRQALANSAASALSTIWMSVPRFVFVAGFQRIAAVAVGAPGPGLLARPVGLGVDDHFLGGHEDRVEAHAKLADDLVQRLGSVRRPPPGRTWRPEWAIVPRFSIISSWFMPMPVSLMVSVLVLRVEGQRDGQRCVGIDDLVVGQHLELDAVERIRRVGDQLAQKDLAVGVE